MKRIMFFLLSVCVVEFFCFGAMAQTPSGKQPAMVLKGGVVWDGVADQPLGAQEILIKDGKIAEIGKTVTIPPGAKIIDLSNHTITPGLIDTHVHMDADPNNLIVSGLTLSGTRHALRAVANLRTLLMNGFTSIRDVASFSTDYNTVDLRNAVNAGGDHRPPACLWPLILSPLPVPTAI